MVLTGRMALLALVGLPVAELISILLAAQWIGALPTFLLLVAGAVSGVAVLRLAGHTALQELRREARSGRLDGAVLVGASRLVVVGVLLMLPGFLSDVAAALLSIPAVGGLLSRRTGRRSTADTVVDLTPAEYRQAETRRLERRDQ